MRRALLLVPIACSLAACGSQHVAAKPVPPQVRVHAYGSGASRVWVFQPAAKPKLIVLYVHGLGDRRRRRSTTGRGSSISRARATR